MNKLSKILFILGIAMMVFSIGYKIGDARGYEAGYTEGYRYDCREEIGNLYEQVKLQKKVTDFTSENLKKLLHENDSLKNPVYAQKRYEDSLAILRQYSEDSLRNWKDARRKNDSLAKIVGSNTNIYNDDGKFNPFACLSPEIEKKVAECAKHKNFIQMFRKQSEF